ncbi:MAG: hypothetical protein Q7S61_00620 [bacterium]|nr:hypothetical protein [bacterium]
MNNFVQIPSEFPSRQCSTGGEYRQICARVGIPATLTPVPLSFFLIFYF